MISHTQHTQPTVATSTPMATQIPIQMSTQPNPYLAQMEAMHAQMLAMQQAMASMQVSISTQQTAKKTRKPKTPKDPNAPKQPIPEGTTAWISYVQLIRSELDAHMKSTDPSYKGTSWKDAMMEAKRLKDLGDSRYAYVPKSKTTVVAKQPIAQLPLPNNSPVLQAVPTQVVPKTVVRKTVVPKTVVPKTVVPKTVIPAEVAQTTSGVVMAEEQILEEVTIDGIAYLMSSNKECWLMEFDGSLGSWAGVYDCKTNTIDDSIAEPSI
jgi:hypothetical protein